MTTVAKRKEPEKKLEEIEINSVSRLQIFSYGLLKDHVEFLFPRLKGLQKSMKQSMMPVPFDIYVSYMVFTSLIVGIITAVGALMATLILNIQPASIAILLPFISGIAIGQITFFAMLYLPSVKVKNRSAKLTEELPHFLGYMATLATNGLKLESIFKAISKENTDEEIVKDCQFLTRNIDILGMDLLTAISDLIKRVPKGPYSELLEGEIITVQTGGDLKEFFIATAQVQLEEKKMSLRKSTESLGVMAEMYTILLIVFPLMAIIMLSIMAIMSPDLGGFDLITLMNLLTYIMVPFFGFVLLLMMDTMVPKR
jgi:archaeal flagellar protein FlaJ